MSSRAVLALGANLGDRLAALQGAIDLLAATDGVSVVAVSHVYETAPVGGPQQDDFLNAVIAVETELDPSRLLAACHAVEQAWHREREVRWGPRTLDVDIVAIDGVVMDQSELSIPHPRAATRAFVCVPWLDIDPDARLPEIGSVAALVSRLDVSGVRRALDVALVVPDGVR
ncbi:MAG: 2-amino-4-hydroxy-6-hydroxymethyldihydropteridine diphosphokinase [Actinomycetota bacterium]